MSCLEINFDRSYYKRDCGNSLKGLQTLLIKIFDAQEKGYTEEFLTEVITEIASSDEDFIWGKIKKGYYQEFNKDPEVKDIVKKFLDYSKNPKGNGEPSNKEGSSTAELIINIKPKTSLEDEEALIFKGGAIFSLSRTKAFKTDMIRALLVYTTNGVKGHSTDYNIVLSDADLNLSIAYYKLELFKIINNFLASIDPEWKSHNYLHRDRKGALVIDLTFVDEAMQKAKEALVNIGVVDLEDLQRFYLDNDPKVKSKAAAYLAANAYLNLKYFDKNLKDNLGDLITYDKYVDLNTIIYSNNATVIKYRIGNDKSHIIKNWNIGEFRDALLQSAKLTLLLIDSLVLYDFDTDSMLHSKIALSRVSTSWNNLLDSVYSLTKDSLNKSQELQEIKNALALSISSPAVGILKVFDILFANKHLVKPLRTLLEKHILSKEDINVLYSIYKLFLSNDEKGINTVENNALSLGNGILKDYLLLDIMINLLQRVQKATYWVTIGSLDGISSKELVKSDTIRLHKFAFIQGTNLKLLNQSKESREWLHGSKYNPNGDNDYDSENYSSYNIVRTGPGTLGITLNGRRYTFINRDRSKNVRSWVKPGRLEIISEIPSDIKSTLIDIIMLDAKANPSRKDSNETLIASLQNDTYLETGNYKLEDFLDTLRKEIEAKNEQSENSDEIQQNKMFLETIRTLKNLLNPLLYYMNSNFGPKLVKEILDNEPQHDDIRALFKLLRYTLGLDFQSEMGLNTLSYFRAMSSRKTKSKNEDFDLEVEDDSEVGLLNLEDIILTMLKYIYFNELSLENDGKVGGEWKQAMTTVDPLLYDPSSRSYAILKSNNHYLFNVISGESWVDGYFIAEALYTGEATKSVTKDALGNNIANYRPASLGAGILLNLSDLQLSLIELDLLGEFSPLRKNIFVNDLSLISGVYYDTSMETKADTKANKDCTSHELIYNGIMHNCFNSILLHGTMVVMPTVYSDKTSFISYAINMLKGDSATFMNMSSDAIFKMYLSTTGDYYILQYLSIAKEFLTLFAKSNIKSTFKNDIELALKDINNLYRADSTMSSNSFAEKVESLLLSKLINSILDNGSTKSKDGRISKSELETLIRNYDGSINISLDGHYRVDKATKRLYFNELSSFYGNLFNSTIEQRIAKEHRTFAKILLQNNVSFKCDGVNSIIGRLIQSGFVPGIDFATFDKNWIEHGQLIIAKNKETGQPIYSVDEITNDFSIELNPILAKYFALDNLFSSNLKYSLVGNEINDPLKAAGLNMEKDFDFNSENSDRSLKSDKEKEILMGAPEDTINILKKTNLTELLWIINDARKETLSRNTQIKKRILEKIQRGEFSIPVDWYSKYTKEIQALQKEFLGNRGKIEYYAKIGKPVLEASLQDAILSHYINANWVALSSNEITYGLPKLSWFAENIEYLLKKYNDLIYRVIATSEGSLYKRNVIIPATKSTMLSNGITGVGKFIRVATIEDPLAIIFNVSGDKDSEDANDGSAKILMCQSILENGSLGVDKVNDSYKKPIWYHYDPKTGTSVLLKFATFAASNGKIRLSMASPHGDYALNKKMMNILWKTLYDLCNSVLHQEGAGTDIGTKLRFKDHILKTLIDGLTLIYESNGVHYSITDFESIKDSNGDFLYFTREVEVEEASGEPIEGTERLRALIFEDHSSNHYTELVQRNGESDAEFKARAKEFIDKNKEYYHSINSVFELWEAMGGCFTETLNGTTWIPSDNSHYAIVGFMNNVEYYTDEAKKLKAKKDAEVTEEAKALARADKNYKGNIEDIHVEVDWADLNLKKDLYYYAQPLKTEFIGYLAHSSAVKRGAFNMNGIDVLTDDSKSLNSTLLRSSGLGTQLDPTHEADEAELTEMSLVIASLDAGGMMHPFAKLAFKDLGRVTMAALGVSRDALIEFIQNSSGNPLDRDLLIHRLYDIFARLFIQSFKGRQKMDLVNSIVDVVKREFNLNENHLLDLFKLPVSDPNVFLQITATFIGGLNNNVLKRKYSGIGDVMVPAYNRAMLYHLDNDSKTYTALDIYDRALKTKDRKSSDIQTLIKNANLYEEHNEGFYVFSYLKTLPVSVNEEKKIIDNDDYYDELEKSPHLNLLPASKDSLKTILLNNCTDLLDVLKMVLAARTKIDIGEQVFCKDIDLTKYGFVKDEPNVYRKYNISNLDLHNMLCNTYLALELNKTIYMHQDHDWFQPTDGVDVIFNSDDTEDIVYLNLDDIDTYYDYIENPRLAAVKLFAKNIGVKLTRVKQVGKELTVTLEKGILKQTATINIETNDIVLALNDALIPYDTRDDFYKVMSLLSPKVTLSYRENIIKPRNLRPQRITFNIQRDGRTVRQNMYNIDPIVIQHKLRSGTYINDYLKDYLTAHNIDITEFNELAKIKEDRNLTKEEKNAIKKLGSNIQKLVQPLVESELIRLLENKEVSINGTSYKVTDLDNLAAELMMTDVFASLFNMGPRTLADKLEDVTSVGIELRYIPKCDLILSNNKNLIGVTFSDEFKTRLKTDYDLFNYTTKKEGKIVKLYKTDKTNTRFLTEIGFLEELPTDVYTFDADGNIYELVNGKRYQCFDSSIKLVNGKVVKEHFYVSRYTTKVLNSTDSAISNIRTFWHIDEKAIARAVALGVIENPTKESNTDKIVKQYMGTLLKKLAKESQMTIVQLNQSLTSDPRYVAQILGEVGKAYGINLSEGNLNRFTLETIYDAAKFAYLMSGRHPYDTTAIINDMAVKYKDLLTTTAEKYKELRKRNLELALYFTVARIPAQSLQSYMLMKCVGYLHGNDNEVMVSHWLTWLQGSDYDIDKAYIMGFNFNDSGQFKDWSDIFDYSSIETIRASLELPTPEHLKFYTSENQLTSVINPIQNKISEEKKKIEELEKIKVGDKTKVQKEIEEANQRINSLLKEIDTLKEKVDISDEIKALNITYDKAERIRIIGKLLRKLLDTGKLHILLNLGSAEELSTMTADKVPYGMTPNTIVTLLQKHEDTYIDPEDEDAVYKNAVSGKILLIVNDPKNIALAYSPISMSDLRKMSDDSPMGNLVATLTGMNPCTKFIMQNLNMTGKAVIGIAAVGEKVFMGLSYYFNEGVRSNDKDWERHMQFVNTTIGIKNRSKNKREKCTFTGIADTNFYKVIKEEGLEAWLAKFYQISKLYSEHPRLAGESDTDYNKRIISMVNNHTLADLMISLLLSAATDNAKELILSKINAGKDLANVYLHLLILGYDMADIVAFMTSPAVLMVADQLNTCIFDLNNSTLLVSDGIHLIKNGISMYNFPELMRTIRLDPRLEAVYDMVDESIPTEGSLFINNFLSILYELNPNAQKLIDEIRVKLYPNSKKIYPSSFGKIIYYYIINNPYHNLREVLNKYFELYHNNNSKLDNAIFRFMNSTIVLGNKAAKAYRQTTKSGERIYNSIDDFILDLDTLSDIQDAANETTNLGTLMGLNRGVPANYSELLAKINSVENMINKRSRKLKIDEIWNHRKNTSDSVHQKEYTELLKLLLQNSGLSIEEITKILDRANKFGILERFDLMKYVDTDINGDEYAKAAIDFYDLIKSLYNILHVMQKIPLYNAALKTFSTAHKLMQYSSMSATLTEVMRLAVSKKGHTLTAALCGLLEVYALDLIISHWLEQRDKKLSFFINKGLKYITPEFDTTVNDGSTKTQNIDTPEAMASFKLWFELYLIPQIILGRVKLGDETIIIPQDNKLRNYLINRSDSGKLSVGVNVYMGLIEDSEVVAKQYWEALLGLKHLDLNNGTGYKLLDYFMLYNILVMHNAPGNERMTNMFSEFIKSGDDNLMQEYMQYVAKIDLVNTKELTDEGKLLMLKSLGFILEDAEFKIAPTYSTYNYRSKPKLAIIKVRQQDGTISYAKLNDNGKYELITDSEYFPFLSSAKSEDIKNERLFNFWTYGINWNKGRVNLTDILEAFDDKKISKMKAIILNLIQTSRLLIQRNCKVG